MDASRFGRALGGGAREAGKALVKAADAAASPAPDRVQARVATGQAAGARAAQKVSGVTRGGKRFGEAVWGPFAKLSGVLWLEVTGVLFGMFAGVAALEVWKGRSALRGSHPGLQHEGLALAMLVVFGWFTLSSFLRASRRGKR